MRTSVRPQQNKIIAQLARKEATAKTQHTSNIQFCQPRRKKILQRLPVSYSILILGISMIVLAACSVDGLGSDGAAASDSPQLETYQPDAAVVTDKTDSGEDVSSESGASTTTEKINVAQGGNEQQMRESNASRISQLLEVEAARLAYNGEVLAENRVPVVAEANGMALTVLVEVGSIVRAGDPLVQLNSVILEAQREQALAGLQGAQAQLDLLLEPAEQSDIAAAQAAVAAAEAAYQRALQGPTNEDLRAAEAQRRQAEAAVSVAQSAYNQVRSAPNIGALPQSLQLQQATLAFEAAQAQFDKVALGTTADVIAGANSQVVAARSQLERLLKGAKNPQIRAVQAQISQAETGLYLAQLQLDKATVRAPIGGIISQVNISVGSMVGSGTPVATILSEEVKVVIPVEEFRLATLEIGQPALVRVDAYPDQLFEGVITIIAPELNSVTRTVDVTIRPSSPEASVLAPGMFATVDLFDPEE